LTSLKKTAFSDRRTRVAVSTAPEDRPTASRRVSRRGALTLFEVSAYDLWMAAVPWMSRLAFRPVENR
jgi:hypothetical protein